MADLRPKGEAMAATVGGGTARIDRTKKGVILVFAIVAGFAAYGYLSQHYEKRQKQDREFAADAKRQVELMTEPRLVGEASARTRYRRLSTSRVPPNFSTQASK